MTPALDQEVVEPDEEAATAALISLLQHMMQSFLRKQGAGATVQRDVHIKMHGLMRAEFSVDSGLPPELRVGLFARPASYPAWVRISSAANANQPDGWPDIRGMAIKLIGVPGRKLATGEEDAMTHDFILISAPIFPTRTAAQFAGLAAAVIGGLLHKALYFLTHWRVAWILLTTFKRHANPLQLRYWSAVPFLFGERAVKYGVRPHVAVADRVPLFAPANQLRLAAKAQLAQGDALFDFCVQLQTDESRMPLEDPRVAWNETASPMRRVATLRILQQDFDTGARDRLGDSLSFTPWHAMREHQPLGSINRTRRILYETLSTFRHRANQVPRREPTGWDA